jgi:hypothetical protein
LSLRIDGEQQFLDNSDSTPGKKDALLTQKQTQSLLSHMLPFVRHEKSALSIWSRLLCSLQADRCTCGEEEMTSRIMHRDSGIIANVTPKWPTWKVVTETAAVMHPSRMWLGWENVRILVNL